MLSWKEECGIYTAVPMVTLTDVGVFVCGCVCVGRQMPVCLLGDAGAL